MNARCNNLALPYIQGAFVGFVFWMLWNEVAIDAAVVEGDAFGAMHVIWLWGFGYGHVAYHDIAHRLLWIAGNEEGVVIGLLYVDIVDVEVLILRSVLATTETEVVCLKAKDCS